MTLALRRLDPRHRSAERRNSRVRHQLGGFSPSQLSAVAAWLRLQASSQSGGDWTNWLDVINSNPAASTDSSRRPAVGTNSGLPTAIYDGAVVDTVSWPVHASNNGTSVYGFWLKIKPTGVTSTQYVMTCSIGTGGASGNKMNFAIVNPGILAIDLFFAGVARTYKSANNALTAGTAISVGFTYDNAGSLETDKMKMIVGNAYVSYTPSGAGTPGVLPSPTGNLVIGNYQDAAAGALPYVGRLGPNLFSLNRHLTAAELINLDAFETFT